MQYKYLISMGIIIVAVVLATVYFIQKPGPAFVGERENTTICFLNYSNSGLIMIAQENGFFMQNGLDVTLKEIPSGRIAMDSMFRGDCNIAHTSETPAVSSSFSRNDFSIFAMISFSDNNNKIIALTETGIREPGDLRGKRIATSEGSASHFFLQVFLAKNGISPDDVIIIFMDAEEAPKALASREIDAFSQGEPYIRRAKGLLGDKAVIFARPGLNIITSDLAALNSYIKEKPEVIDRLLLALIQAEEYSRKNPDETLKRLSKQYGIDESDMSAILQDTRFRVALDESLVFAMEDRARWMIQNNQTNSTVIPNYLDFIYTNNLERIKPDAVTIIH